MSDRAAADRGDRMGVGTLVISSVFALVVGAVGGLITTFTHAQLAPWALIAGLAVVVALVLGFRLVFGSRIVGAVGGAGFIAAEIALTLPAAGAPVLALDGPLGWIWAIAPGVLAVAAVAVPWPGSAASRP
jgi:N-acetyl-1-D-myo-inositol-2-amino-2-deoxy-alpha-D-glucopyranoside deacetylase